MHAAEVDQLATRRVAPQHLMRAGGGLDIAHGFTPYSPSKRVYIKRQAGTNIPRRPVDGVIIELDAYL
jgi:hypothetical protein